MLPELTSPKCVASEKAISGISKVLSEFLIQFLWKQNTIFKNLLYKVGTIWGKAEEECTCRILAKLGQRQKIIRKMAHELLNN